MYTEKPMPDSGDGAHRNGAIPLESSLIIRDVQALKAQLDAHAEGEAPIVIDGAAVCHVDTAGLQLLLGFVRHLERQSRSLTWRDVSGALREKALLAGLSDALQLPPEEVEEAGLCPVF